MFYPAIQPPINHWLPNLVARLRQLIPTIPSTPAQQIYLQPDDTYHVDAGVYRLRVLAGSVWVSEQGIFAAGEQVQLTPGAAGLPVRAVQHQPAVFELKEKQA
jgi:hypothetical protein